MDRLACNVCKQCNRKGKPSVTRLSKYCDEHYIKRVKTKRSIFGFLTKVKDKIYDRRIKYNEDGSIKDFNSKGFRKDWFIREK